MNIFGVAQTPWMSFCARCGKSRSKLGNIASERHLKRVSKRNKNINPCDQRTLISRAIKQGLLGERKKTINIKNFGRTPPGVRPVCPGDTSHLSRDMSPSVPGTFCPFSIDLHINQAPNVPMCPWDGSGASGRQIPLCDFSLSVFFSPYYFREK